MKNKILYKEVLNRFATAAGESEFNQIVIKWLFFFYYKIRQKKEGIKLQHYNVEYTYLQHTI